VKSPDVEKTEKIRAYLKEEYEYFDLVEVLKERDIPKKHLKRKKLSSSYRLPKR